MYHFSIIRGFANLYILCFFARFWSGTRALVKCGNDAIVEVLNTGKAKDSFLGLCGCNIWYMAALADVDLKYLYVLAKNNTVADFLLRTLCGSLLM